MPHAHSREVVGQTLTQAGFTGLGITPNAHLLGWGRAALQYDNQVPGVVRNPGGHNFVLGFGLLPNLEIAGRLAANTLHTNCFAADCGARDLSASAKAAIGLDAAGRFRIGGGFTDVGGEATFFRTLYGVLTYDEGPFQASAGFAQRSGAGVAGSRSPLSGVFAAAAWQPLPWVRGHLEYADGNAWAGLRVFAPDGWLPEGWRLSAGAQRRLTDSALTERQWLSASLSIPLYKVPSLPARPGRALAPLPVLQGEQRPLPAYEAREPALPAIAAPAAGSAAGPTVAPPTQTAPDAGVVLPGESAAAPTHSVPRAGGGAVARPAPSGPPPQPAEPATQARLESLADALARQGLQDIWIGRMADGSLAIRADNGSYRWNSVDALGAALGAIARELGDTRQAYRLVLSERQIPLVAVTGQADCLREWVASDASTCPGGELSTPGSAGPLAALHAGATWVVQNTQPSTRTLNVSLSPVLRTQVGTEVGAFDASLGAALGLQLPVWPGGSVELRQLVPVANSRNYEDAGVFAPRRVRNLTERLTFTQTVRLPLERWVAPGDELAIRRWGLAAVTGQLTVGRIGGWYDGALAALRWEPGDGVHRVSAQAGAFRHDDPGSIEQPGPRNARPLLASYRYHVAPTRTYLEATAGQFFFNDRGVQLGLRQWFTDVNVHVFYRRSQFSGEPTRQFAGVEISLPLGPRRDWSALPHLRVGGTSRFSTGLETVVRGGANPTVFGYGVLPPAPSLDATFNSDRSALVHFEDSARRIRDAARATSERPGTGASSDKPYTLP
ncbi:YjbH domain-containing protein [Ramlibacter sp. AN1015]|uniref:YjbH domain-containing protein n=1 Tax=Ramlibacter sp. AN1015 TaxID=3133428 RepID=UPI0030C51A46